MRGNSFGRLYHWYRNVSNKKANNFNIISSTFTYPLPLLPYKVDDDQWKCAFYFFYVVLIWWRKMKKKMYKNQNKMFVVFSSFFLIRGKKSEKVTMNFFSFNCRKIVGYETFYCFRQWKWKLSCNAYCICCVS